LIKEEINIVTSFSDVGVLESLKKLSFKEGDGMSKRGSPAVPVLIVIGVVGAFLYGFYCYHDQHTRLKRSEESSDKLRQKTESLSAQLQGKASSRKYFFDLFKWPLCADFQLRKNRTCKNTW